MKKEELWKEWLRLHLPSIRLGLGEKELAEEMQQFIERKNFMEI